MSIVYIRTMIEGMVLTFHLDLVELQSSSAGGVGNVLLASLKRSGMINEYLSMHWLGLTTDGCSTMLGRNGGLAALLPTEYPRTIVWHCMAHRLELAVNDALKDITETNHFCSFMEKLYIGPFPCLQRMYVS